MVGVVSGGCLVAVGGWNGGVAAAVAMREGGEKQERESVQQMLGVETKALKLNIWLKLKPQKLLLLSIIKA